MKPTFETILRAGRIPFLFFVVCTSSLASGGPADSQPTDSEALGALVENLEILKADPNALSAIEARMDRYEEEILDEQATLVEEIASLRKRLEEAKRERENLRSRLGALQVAGILLEDFSSEPGTVVAESPGESPEPPLSRGGNRSAVVDAEGVEIPKLTRTVDFATEVYPIFENRCFECHGPKKQRGQYRLDAREVVYKGGHSGTGVTPGRAVDSELFRRVAGLGDEDRMPPVGEKLTTAEIALIRAWIDQGAEWPEGVGSDVTRVAKHWAYVPPKRPPLPEVRDKQWPRNPIDFFVLAQLEREGLHPSEEAARGSLLRRVSLDLTGLPPSPRELEAFLNDSSPDAYEKVVDRLLKSPYYGERWARVWLDLARYADTNGYEKDRRREMWPWRDWVIRAFNENKPFDEFTIEQLAGDLLPNPSRDQLVATGFHRNTMLNDEGGTDPEEFRIVAVKDRVETTGAVWLGTTLGCAQCHDHKYDPFSQKEYYQLLGFFNSTQDVGTGQDPVLELPTPEQEQLRSQLRDRIEELNRVLNTQTPELAQAQREWEQRVGEALKKWKVLEPEKYSSTQGSILTQLEDHSLLAIGKNPDNDVYEIEARVPFAGITGLRLEVLPHETLPQGGPGRKDNGGFVVDRLRVEAVNKEGESSPIRFRGAYADHTEQGFEVGSLVGLVEGRGWATDSSKPGHHVARVAIFSVSGQNEIEPGQVLRIGITHAYGRGHNLGRFRLSVTRASDPIRENEVPKQGEILQILSAAPEDRSDEQKTKLAQYFRSITPELENTRKELEALKRELENLPIATTMVMKELEQPRETHVLTRGNFLSPAEKVEPGVPRALNPFPSDAPRNRLGLAKWLVDRNNPLTARVFVNRVWLTYFGRGLVKTSEDFGTQGDPPSHPDLLDWLAVEFMESGWDIKHLHRLIVTSAVYRQSSKVTPQLRERDPYNVLLTRGPRFRMEAEMVRDNALAISGLLNRRIGGPSVFPPQPEGIWSNSFTVHDTKDRWIDEEGPNRYRRGIYTFLRRTSPYPSLLMFDAPYRDVCTIQRPRTNTPLQALTTLNDPTFIEASGGLARRILSEGGESFEDRIRYGFLLCVARPPTEKEVEVQRSLCRKAMATYRKHPELARQIWVTSRLDLNGLDPIRFAAWTLVSNVLLNMDETITKG